MVKKVNIKVLIHKDFRFAEYAHCLTVFSLKAYNYNIWRKLKAGEYMEVQEIPIPAVATIKVSKEGKSAIFETTVIQTSDNKYIYILPIRSSNKLVNFSGQGLVKELRILTNGNKAYLWRNISISKFVESGSLFLRIKTKSAGIQVESWMERQQKTSPFKAKL